MIINKLILKNYKLFKDLELAFDKINIIKGKNASGKSSILNGIILTLFGEGSGINLNKLISFGEKSAELKIETDKFTAIRKIPTALQIFQDNKEIQFNTPTLKQNWINEQIGNYDFFKKYRLLNKQAVNLLDLGIVSLRKELMSFIDTDFTTIRQNLLNEKLNRETYSVNKKLYHFYLSPKRKTILESGLNNLKVEGTDGEKSYAEQRTIVNSISSEIQTKERLIYNRQRELQEVQKSGICPILKRKCTEITKSITPEQLQKINSEIIEWNKEIIILKESLTSEQDYLNHIDNNNSSIRTKKQMAESYIMKLKEAQKFSAYKFTTGDVKLYNDSIKVWDDFAGWYIQNWLDNLTCILNNLLKEVDMRVSFSADKQFITITNEGQQMDYESLSSMQQTFLNVVFKLSILLHNGINTGIIIIDEGINALNFESLDKLIAVLKTLNFQFFLIYQNIPEIEEVNIIEIERKNGRSEIK